MLLGVIEDGSPVVVEGDGGLSFSLGGVLGVAGEALPGDVPALAVVGVLQFDVGVSGFACGAAGAGAYELVLGVVAVLVDVVS